MKHNQPTKQTNKQSTLIILFDISNKSLAKDELFYLTHKWNPNRYYHSGSEWICE